MNDSMRQILENKLARRKELAALPVGEKLRLLEQMIADTRAITASRRQKPTQPVQPPPLSGTVYSTE